jgi:hypothetical protein
MLPTVRAGYGKEAIYMPGRLSAGRRDLGGVRKIRCGGDLITGSAKGGEGTDPMHLGVGERIYSVR